MRLLLTINSCHHEANLCCVGSTGKVSVYLFGLVLIERHEAVQDVVARRRVVGSTFSNINLLMFPTMISRLVELAFIVREIVLHWGNREFLFKSIDLV